MAETTATQINIEKHQKQAQERALHARLRWFNSKWQPDDPHQAAEFYAELIILIQEMHRDANKEVIEIIKVALTARSPQSMVIP